MSHTAPHVDRHIPFKRGGWGTAALVCLLALLTAASAAYVHNRTYKSPNDLRMHAKGTANAAE